MLLLLTVIFSYLYSYRTDYNIKDSKEVLKSNIFRIDK